MVGVVNRVTLDVVRRRLPRPVIMYLLHDDSSRRPITDFTGCVKSDFVRYDTLSTDIQDDDFSAT